LIISMGDSKWLSLGQIRAFFSGAEPVEIAAQRWADAY
jgi:hypothetical protein